jgi:hypothetical protein
MHRLSNQSDEAVFVTVEAASRLTSLGRNTVRRMAEECNAARKIGRSVRINRKIFLNYVDSFEA